MRHYNPTLAKNTNRAFNLKGENTNEVNDEIQPVVLIEDILDITRHAIGAGSVIYTTPADKDFYLSAYSLSFEKNAADTGTQIYIQVTIQGVNRRLGSLCAITSVANRGNDSLSLPKDLKLDRGTTISVEAAGSFTVATGTIYGHTSETLSTL